MLPGLAVAGRTSLSLPYLLTHLLSSPIKGDEVSPA